MLFHLLRSGVVTAPVVAPVVVPLTVQGVTLRRPDATIWKYRCVTAFRAPELYGLGEHGWLDDYYAWCLSLGANAIRVFAMWSNTDYMPRSASYYDDFAKFLEFTKAAGLYVHVVALCDQVDGSSVFMSVPQRDEHVGRLLDLSALSENVLFEIENESWKNGRDAYADRYESEVFAGHLAMRSSWPEENPPVDPSLGGWLSLGTKHLDRGTEWTRKGKTLHEMQFEGLGAYPAAKVPSISGEPERIGEATTPRQHADNAAVCELMGAGGCLHGGYMSFDPSHDSDLQNCRARGSANAMACAAAVADVWHATTWDVRVGSAPHLTRGTENNSGECPTVHWDRYNENSPHNHPTDGLCRSYYKLLDGKYYGLGVDPAPLWPGYVTRNGWRIVDQGGYTGDGHGGNLLKLER